MQKSLLSKIVTVGSYIDTECPVCCFACSHQEDIDSVKKNGACSECCLNFMYTMGEEWERGVRPSVDEARKKMNYGHNYNNGGLK